MPVKWNKLWDNVDRATDAINDLRAGGQDNVVQLPAAESDLPGWLLPVGAGLVSLVVVVALARMK